MFGIRSGRGYPSSRNSALPWMLCWPESSGKITRENPPCESSCTTVTREDLALRYIALAQSIRDLIQLLWIVVIGIDLGRAVKNRAVWRHRVRPHPLSGCRKVCLKRAGRRGGTWGRRRSRRGRSRGRNRASAAGGRRRGCGQQRTLYTSASAATGSS